MGLAARLSGPGPTLARPDAALFETLLRTARNVCAEDGVRCHVGRNFSIDCIVRIIGIIILDINIYNASLTRFSISSFNNFIVC